MDLGESTFTIDGYAEILSRVSQEQLRKWEIAGQLRGGPIPAVLDTSCVRTALKRQLTTDEPPASLRAAQDGQIRLFMERATLEETWTRLARFAEQLGCPVVHLQRLFVDEWLPLIRVVSLPGNLRALDRRATAVQALDPDDYPAAALAALLSPCILLTHNTKDFAPLGVHEWTQGVDAVVAALDVRFGETRVQVVTMVPLAPVYAVGAGVKWAYERIGPAALLILAAVILGGIYIYRRQPEERRQTIRTVAGGAGKFLMEQYTAASEAVQKAQDQLCGCVVPAPEKRTAPGAVFRLLAMSDDSMSAQQIYEALDQSVRPSVQPLRQWLHGNKAGLFREVRRGSFALGSQFGLSQPLPAV
ncbi:MAG: hypothetical protein M0005_11135 [Actinomycetota bacterium]|jgi:hypothetical protein|nr:hypothetical protein [Actinomycetota bacterium]